MRAVILLAHSLKRRSRRRCGDERATDILHLLKCDEIQGYLFSKPLPLKRSSGCCWKGGF